MAAQQDDDIAAERHTRRLAVVGILANAFGVVAAVQGFLKGDVLLRAAVGLLVVGCLLAGGSAAIGVDRLVNPRGTDTALPPPPRADPDSAAETMPPVPTTTAARSSGATSTGPRKLVDQTVVLPRDAAVDVDAPGQEAVTDHDDGATGDHDLFHDWGQVRSDNIQAVNGPNIYPYSGGSPSQAYHTCKSDMDRPANPNTGGGDFCFRTSEGRTAFASTTRTREDKAFVLHVIVWDDPAA
ncbi:hypothetical protein [Actinokineospora spheciospongiae]|uniref:hypothetical protein n=1 Tax=Actinokineospora spheciospongiae TaxID=909613 RepID=UPI000D70905D|nr:hypothetical protein [Actinokineospora spheciospongiae]PWW53150.1 hypothetical protein DFQ13_116140 [Actinokineospora spheciospongiae]